MDVLEFLRAQPVFTLFIILGLGYLIGRIKVGAISLGPVAGVLFVGLFFGNLGFQMSPGVQSFGFALFIFSVGYQAGPRFFAVLKADGLKYFVLAVTVAGSGLAIAVLLSGWLGFEPGTSAGILSGGLTSSPTLAAAQEAIRSGTVSPPQGWSADQVIGNITTGYAITYIFGLVGLILIVKLLPPVLGVDLAADAAQYESESNAGSEVQETHVSFRVYKVTNPKATEVPIRTFLTGWDGFSWLRLHRGGEVTKPGLDGRLRLGDEVSVVGDLALTEKLQRLGEDVTYAHPEIADADSAQIIVSDRDAVGKTLADLDLARRFGVFVRRWQRLGQDVPRTLHVAVQRGDVLSVIGPSAGIDSASDALGSAERPSDTTDMLTFSLGIAAGVVVGTLSITVAGTPIGLGSAGGLLLAGIVVGFVRSVRPTFGRMSSGARWLLMELGLLIFMIGVGLRAGGGIVETFVAAGPKLILAGALVTTLPLAIGYAVGRKVLGLPPVILFGAVVGAMTSGAALSVVTGAAKSEVPALGYAGTYAFANVLLTIAGTIIVGLS